MATTALDSSELCRLLGRWTTGRATLADDLVTALVELIDVGLVPAGALLPPQRGLATALLVSRGTVTAAYEALEARGYVATNRGSGSRVRSARGQLHARPSGRLFSFTSAPADVIDLSTGSLPASPVAAEVLGRRPNGELTAYLSTDGYFPAGLPVLRQAIADRYTRDGLPTRPQQILVTSGAQQATWLAVTSLAGSGDLVLMEEPTYRGALEVVRSTDSRVEGLPLDGGGIDVEQVRRALSRKPQALYCQTAIHNPTGRGMSDATRSELAAVINGAGLATIEDTCSADLTLNGPAVARTLAGLVNPELLMTIGSASKLFWGGVRIGWIRACETRIHGLVELRKAVDLASSIVDQLLAVELIGRTDVARAQRRTMLTDALAATEAELTAAFPEWSWAPIRGGSGLWVDTGQDAVALAERGKRVGVRLAAGPGFSTYAGQRTFLRLPVWHEPTMLRAGLTALNP
ncbi:PLP-dependent aminotransferase family protein [Cryptosporangium aurantiacum]|uniref:DNA-binding transcriptional regulator, MocR family, contains an aminotransferase domain n=1 Tax=Cryptosporangium aurantiacum TaxID=134849 RepID=A0A1M7RCP3_9ACTN|nr:PLP-dependent aminotransferase family protein [Cryptosporangium aurantiacum]SHN44053.1 DNA-binding transcriptional regulator, MocR family, contains an aminotransferase domain [Cryptosporangium aurantiacum]